jgi:hypothetical protein
LVSNKQSLSLTSTRPLRQVDPSLSTAPPHQTHHTQVVQRNINCTSLYHPAISSL